VAERTLFDWGKAPNRGKGKMATRGIDQTPDRGCAPQSQKRLGAQSGRPGGTPAHCHSGGGRGLGVQVKWGKGRIAKTKKGECACANVRKIGAEGRGGGGGGKKQVNEEKQNSQDRKDTVRG